MDKVYEAITGYYPTAEEFVERYCKTTDKDTCLVFLRHLLFSNSAYPKRKWSFFQDAYASHMVFGTNHCWAIVSANLEEKTYTVTKVRKVLKGFKRNKYTLISKTYTFPTYIEYCEESISIWKEKIAELQTQIWDLINDPTK